MKKLFLLFALAGFVLTSCGGSAQKQEEQAEQTEQTEQAVEQTEATEVTDSAEIQDGDTTKVVEITQE